MSRAVVLHGRYLGGHPARESPTQAGLKIDESGVVMFPAIGMTFRPGKGRFEEPWSNVTELAAEGPDQVASRFTATRLFLGGPLALAFKKKEKVGYVAVRGGFGEFLFEVKGKTPIELRAKLAPWASQVTASEPATETDAEPVDQPAVVAEPADEPVAASEQDKKIARLQALADLHERGALTDEEFASEKARILSDT
jgi:hypothetical protein